MQALVLVEEILVNTDSVQGWNAKCRVSSGNTFSKICGSSGIFEIFLMNSIGKFLKIPIAENSDINRMPTAGNKS